jgi:hypothetical protein
VYSRIYLLTFPMKILAPSSGKQSCFHAGFLLAYLLFDLKMEGSFIFQHPVALFMSQVYTLFTVLKCNLVFVFRYHFHATCFDNSLPSSGVVPLTISLQFIVKIDV